MSAMPIIYTSQKSAWMDSTIFVEWFTETFISSVKAHQSKNGKRKKTLLPLDNDPTHSSCDILNEKDEFIKVMFLPPNVTSLLQPMDQGVIETFKRYYRKELLPQNWLAKALKPFAEGEFIKECMLEVCGVLCPEKKNEFEKISLSRRTVVRRIEMIANDIKTTLTDRMAGFESFSIALDESTDLSDKAQLAVFIRGIDKEFTVTEELLTLQPLKATTTGEDIFNEVQKFWPTMVKINWSMN
ncbi:tigger transposable element-derived protein 1-like [Diorhabda carinulata]|uniref:tigger transposable element-derived protein 1-like n=1 Tax=Diorhabda carinulata TaxID=1163345 RepID=UPI0025A180DD|nr:tigger transposable element-derived protein 1-like [Diorhabda carinulata]